MGDKLIPFLSPNLLFEIVKEGETLLVRDSRESIVRIFPLEVDYQLCEFMTLSKLAYGVRQRFPANDG